MLSTELLWAVGLILLGAVLGTLELFIPTAGLLGIGAVISLVAGIFVAFSHSTLAGFVAIGVVACGGPLFFLLAVRWWPHTPIGRRILNLPPDDLGGVHLFGDERIAELRKLIGRVAVAKTDLLPSGLIEIDNQRLDAVVSGTAVNRGDAVEIFSVEAGKIRVRPTSRFPESRESLVVSPRVESKAMEMSTSLDSLGLDDLDFGRLEGGESENDEGNKSPHSS